MQRLSSFVRPAIVVLWLFLLYVQYTHPDASDARGSIEVPAVADRGRGDEEWTSVYIKDRKVGYTRRRWRDEGGERRFEERSYLRLTVLDTEQVVRTELRGTVGSDHTLRSFDLSLRSGAGTMEAKGRIEGGHFDLVLNMNGQESRQSLDLTGPVYVPSIAREQLVRAGLEIGRELTVSVFDPSSMQNHPLQMSVTGQELNAAQEPLWRVREQFRGIETTVWFDAEGRVVREEGPMGFKAVREDPESVLAGGWQDGKSFDLMAAVAIPVKEIADPRHLSRLEARLDGLRAIQVPVDGRQRVDGSLLTVERENGAEKESFRLPYEGQEWRAELAATPFLQADHPQVRAKAVEVLGGESDARRASERLKAWMFRELGKVPTATIPNALQALVMKAGDCNEHAVLFAALARAVGLPARVVAGTVYVDGVFLYHAWNEVWLGQSWVSVDTTMDQMPVDATHIKLVEGGPEAHVALVPLIGSLSIDIVRAE